MIGAKGREMRSKEPLYSPADRAITSLLLACDVWKDLLQQGKSLVNHDARAWERIRGWPTEVGSQWLEKLFPFRFTFGRVYRKGNTDRNVFSSQARSAGESTNDFGMKLAGQWADRLPGGLHPMGRTELWKVKAAQQQDPDLIALVLWMYGNRPSSAEVRASQPDLQHYYQLIKDSAGTKLLLQNFKLH